MAARVHMLHIFTGSVFHAEVALFDTSGLRKHCDFDAVGGARRVSWLADAALVAVVLASSVLGATACA